MIKSGQRLCVAPQSLYEFYVVATRPVWANGFGWNAARALVWIDHFHYAFTFLSEDGGVYGEWRKAVEGYGTVGKPAHDARLYAIMGTYGISSILTFDAAGFARYGVTVLDPRTI